MQYRHYNSPYTPREKLKALTLWQTSSTEFVCHRYHCTDRSLRRWRSQYDGTLQSLENRSHRPLTPHPREQTAEEKRHILNLIRRTPSIGLNELYGKLRQKYGYARNPATLYRYLKREGFYDNRPKKKPYTPKPYDTPEQIGEKWQLDVKFVPFECRTYAVLADRNFFQYEYCERMAYQGPSIYSPFFSLVELERPWYYRIPPFNSKNLSWFEEHQDVTLAAWSAQGRGFFGDYPQYDPENADALTRMAVLTPVNYARKERVKKLAEVKNIRPSQISLLYVLSQKASVAAIIGPRSSKDIDNVLNASTQLLTQEEVDYLTLKSDTLPLIK